ncbi:MAG TPA: T9SS type A sorting domain-containing protein [Bacteroidota bacterium]|nr:T9SS type A sorting domain-containing protein [Bacteroidota bacterium]
MKPLFRGLAFMCVGAALGAQAIAQITINVSDVQTQLAPGNMLLQHTDKQTSSANIGSTGSSSWDFSGLHSDSVTTLKSVTVSSTPFAADFTTATHAFQASIVYDGIPVTGYVYLQLATDFSELGIEATAPALGNANLKIINAPPDITYHLPSTINTTWSSNYTATTTVTLPPPLPPIVSSQSYKIAYTVDAYGPLTVPGGYTQDALRIRVVNTSAVKYIRYIFLAPNGASVQLTANDTLSASNGTIGVNNVSWTAPVGTAVKTAPEPGIPGQFALSQNYPNPFNPSTLISFTLPSAGSARLEVFDVLGRSIAVLVDGHQTEGVHTVSWDAKGLASGVYICRLQAGGLLKTMKMVLER